MFAIEEVRQLERQLNEKLKALPFHSIYISTLGGEHRASIMIKVSLDAPYNWPHGIFENSNALRFSLHSAAPKGMSIEFHPYGFQNPMPKIRKSTQKTPEKVLEKMVKHIENLQEYIFSEYSPMYRFLFDIKNDEQLNKEQANYCGFVNTDINQLDEETEWHKGFKMFVKNWPESKYELTRLGLDIEGNSPDLEETIFIPLKAE